MHRNISESFGLVVRRIERGLRMPSKFMNGVAAKHCVTCYDYHEETALDVQEDFVDWTRKKKKKIKIEIAR